MKNVLNIDKVFKNKNGKVVLWQRPNLLICLWIALKITGFILNDGNFKSGITLLATCILFAWSYQELVSGVNYFRKILGLVVLVFTVINLFKIT